MDIIKVILVGETTVGKTSIINKYVRHEFSEVVLPTIGTDKVKKEVEINNQTLNLEIWDTVGQEQYRAANKIFMKNTQIAIIVYDITKKSSFEELDYWIELVKNTNKENIIIVIVGNKSDLYEEREVEEEEGKKFADVNNCLFFESSAKESESVENIFIKCFEKYLEKIENLNEEEKIEINEEKTRRKESIKLKKQDVNNNNEERGCCLFKKKK